MNRPDPLLELTDVTVVKSGRRVLDGLTLRIDIGEHTALIGPNGSGKTTLLNLLTQVDRPLARATGTLPVRVLGRHRWDVFELRSKIGIVTHDLHAAFVGGNSLGPIQAEDAVLSGFFATKGVLQYVSVDASMQRRAAETLARVGAAHLAGVPLDCMSTGEARRVLIARALAPRPVALVLDEPTAGLDLVARQEFLDALHHVAADGVTIVLVTHHVDEVIPDIGRVVLLQDGRVVADGPKDQLLAAPRLSALFGAPISVERRDGYYYATTARR